MLINMRAEKTKQNKTKSFANWNRGTSLKNSEVSTSWAGQETHETVRRAYLSNDSDPLQTEHILVIS